MLKFSFLLVSFLLLTACFNTEQASSQADVVAHKPTIERWYSQTDINVGQQVFTQNCTVCHGQQAEGLVHPWNKTLSDGLYPPPPLNGTAHAWHHPLRGLLTTIQHGGQPIGGKMPGFKDKLNQQQQLAAIAYFQSLWSDEIYQAWLDRGGLS
ncbi:MAG: cytochrome c [Pseudomonadota bacterium]|nr:cytochrome c [Pseudomonadota bacterium]